LHLGSKQNWLRFICARGTIQLSFLSGLLQNIIIVIPRMFGFDLARLGIVLTIIKKHKSESDLYNFYYLPLIFRL
jgi:hypothetical protein